MSSPNLAELIQDDSRRTKAAEEQAQQLVDFKVAEMTPQPKLQDLRKSRTLLQR